MINLNVNQQNEFVIYADTIDSSVQDWGDLFLIGFKSLYSNHWMYVIPIIITRNSRYVQLEVTPVEQGENDDPFNGVIAMFPPGNYEYKVWNITTPVLDPGFGILIDQGQAILGEYTPPEVENTVFISDNENFESIIYYTGVLNNCVINFANSPYIIETDTTNTCQPLEIANTGYLLVKKGLTLTLTS